MDELISKLVSELGINQDQAKGGAGLLFKMAKEKLGGDDFSKIGAALGNVDELIDASPSTEGGGGGLLGGLASAIGGDGAGNLAELASGFKSLDLDSGLLTKFVSIISGVVKDKGGADVVGLLQKLL